MSIWPDRTATALVVVDVQHGVLAEAVDRDGVIDRIGALVDRARASEVEVLWVQHESDEFVPDTAAWAIVDELSPSAGETTVRKRYGDAFEATELDGALRDGGVGHLVVVGAQSDACIRSTIHGAFTRGYDVTLVADAHTTEDLSQWGAPKPEDVIAHTNLYWGFQDAPDRTATVCTTDEVRFDR